VLLRSVTSRVANGATSRFESGSRPGGIAQLVEQDTVRCICHALLFTLLNKMKDAVQMYYFAGEAVKTAQVRILKIYSWLVALSAFSSPVIF